jgi:thioredoxin 1
MADIRIEEVRVEELPEDTVIEEKEVQQQLDIKEQQIEQEEIPKSEIVLFTNPTCPHCVDAKKVMKEIMQERQDIRFIEYSLETFEGMNKSDKMGISSVPTFIIQGPGYPNPIGLRGSQTKETLHKYINKSLGISEAVQQPVLEPGQQRKEGGFFSKFKKFFSSGTKNKE